MRRPIPAIPYLAAELNLPDAPDSLYYQTGAYLREYLRQNGDERWKLPEPMFEREFFLKSNAMRNTSFGASASPFNQETRVLDPLQSLNPFGAYDEDCTFGFAAGDVSPTTAQVSSGVVSPGATKGNVILDAISGAISTIGQAGAIKITGNQTPKPLTTVQQSSNNSMLIFGGLAAIGLVILIASRK